jgi:MFS family permease
MLAHLSHHLIPGLLTPLLPYIRDDLSLTYTQAGWLVSVYSLAYGVSQLPAGWLADRIGPRIMVTIGVAGVGAAGLLIGFSPTYVMLAVFLVLLGIAGGGYHPASVPLVSALVGVKNRGRTLGLHQVGGASGYFLAPLIVAGIASGAGWRGTFLAVSIPSIVFGVVLYMLLGRLGYGKDTEPKMDQSHPKTVPSPMRLRPLVAIMILGIAIMSLVMSTVSFIPLFIVDHFGGVSNEAAAATISLFYLGGLWAGPLGGYISDRLGHMPVIIVSGFIAALAIYLQNLAPLGAAFSAVIIILGMAMHLGMPAIEAYIISHTSQRKRSTILGIYYMGSRGGPVIAPLIGFLIDRDGFYTGFSVVGATMTAVTLVCTIILWRSRDKSIQNRIQT